MLEFANIPKRLLIGEAGKILVDVNWDFLELDLSNTFKISFTDTGVGMTGAEIGEYINQLSSSGGENVFENYGIGAKISSITRNECGVVYESWRGGTGYLAMYQFDKDEDAFGLRQFEQGDGTFSHFQYLEDTYMPTLINEHNGEHGTRVTLIGNADDQDTMAVPAGAKGSREAWVYRTINSRYFEVPDEIEIAVRVGYNRPKDDTKHNYLRIIKGQKAILDRHKTALGVVALTDAKVHWWILNSERQGHGRGRPLIFPEMAYFRVSFAACSVAALSTVNRHVHLTRFRRRFAV